MVLKVTFLIVAGVIIYAIGCYVVLFRRKKENCISVPTENGNSKVCDWLISWLAKDRGVRAETVSRNTTITNEEVYGGTIAAAFHYGAAFYNNLGDVKTVGDFVDLIESQLDQQQTQK